MVKYFEIEFEHPDYSPLDSMPAGMNRRFISANTDVEAQIIFRSRYPLYKNSIRSIKDTGCLTLEEVIKQNYWGDNIKKINQWDIDKGYINFNEDIISILEQNKKEELENPKFRDIINLTIKYIKNLI